MQSRSLLAGNSSICYICHKSFSISSKKVICITCNQAVCKRDVAGEKSCLNCFRSEIEIEVHAEFDSAIHSLDSDVENLKLIREQYKEELKRQEEAICRFNSLLGANEGSYSEVTKALEGKIERETERLRKAKERTQKLKPALETTIDSERDAKDKLKRLKQELEIESIQEKDLSDEETRVLGQLDDLKRETKDTIPAVKLRSMVCGKCNSNLKLQHGDLIAKRYRHVGRESLVESVLEAKHKRTQDEKNPKGKTETVTSKSCRECYIM